MYEGKWVNIYAVNKYVSFVGFETERTPCRAGGRGGSGVRSPDWPFLDKGSQSTGELGREGGRSAMGAAATGAATTTGGGRTLEGSSSSCDSSSSSSCCSSSSSSSSSSRSSSPQSASPRQKLPKESPSSSAAAAAATHLFTATRSEQEWNSHLHWSPPRSSSAAQSNRYLYCKLANHL